MAPPDVQLECHVERIGHEANKSPNLAGYGYEANACGSLVSASGSGVCNQGCLCDGSGICGGNTDGNGDNGRNLYIDLQCGDFFDSDAPTCGNAFVTTRTFCGCTSCCDDSFPCTILCATQRITVMDTTPPELFVPDDITVECDFAMRLPELTYRSTTFNDRWGVPRVNDMCNIPSRIDETVSYGGTSCSVTVTRQFSASDGCWTSTGTQVVTVVDTTPPIIEHPASTSVYCASFAGFLNPPEARDLCQNNTVLATLVNTEEIPGTCWGEATYEGLFSADDGCGNLAFDLQTVTTFDNVPPNISPNPAPHTFIGPICKNNFNPAPTVYTVTDDCSPDSAIKFEANEYTVGLMEDAIDYDIIRTYKATDDCGNSVYWDVTISILNFEVVTISTPLVVGPVDPSTPVVVTITLFDDEAFCDAAGELIINSGVLTVDSNSGAGQFCTPSTTGTTVCDLEQILALNGAFSITFEFNLQSGAISVYDLPYTQFIDFDVNLSGPQSVVNTLNSLTKVIIANPES